MGASSAYADNRLYNPGMDHTSLHSDTSPEASRVQIELWRSMTARQKAEAVDDLNRSVREMAMAGIRQRHPHANERECFLRYAVLTLGKDLAVKAYPEAAVLLEIKR
jgi:hypothetical protein